MSEEVKAKVKAIFPEDVEGIYISKNDYDRLYGDLTLENIELKQEIERLNKQIEEYQKALDETTSEKVDLYSIIKELKEEMENTKHINVEDVYHIIEHEKKLNEILDKVGCE